ncbi:hypothetical protein [Lentzea sp. NPDC092896]|uniref:hypothetical protein n=1 Tax=Lentzea sp. NPDC092896 TaxID=3364127 RepID=UPI00380616E7
MLEVLAQSLITGVVALGGLMLAARLQHGSFAEARRLNQENRVFEIAVELMTAIDAHRFAMWELKESQHEARADSAHRTRTQDTRRAITGPQMSLRVLCPALRASADAAVAATYAMHKSVDIDDLKARRVTAIAAADNFQAEATAFFAAVGIGVPVPGDDRWSPSRSLVPSDKSVSDLTAP